jgi:hypothetical protein
MLPSREDVAAFGHLLFGNQLLSPAIRPLSIQPRTPPRIVKQIPVAAVVIPASTDSNLMPASAEVITVDDKDLMPPPAPISPEPIDHLDLVNSTVLPSDIEKAFTIVSSNLAKLSPLQSAANNIAETVNTSNASSTPELTKNIESTSQKASNADKTKQSDSTVLTQQQDKTVPPNLKDSSLVEKMTEPDSPRIDPSTASKVRTRIHD